MWNRKIGAVKRTATAAAAVIGGLAMTPRAGAVPQTLTGIGSFSESNALTNSTYTNTNLTPGTPSFPNILSREYNNSGAYEIVPFIRIDLSSVPAGQQVTGSQVGLFFTSSTYWGGAPLRQEYMDLWAVKDAFNPDTVTMTTYDGTHPWTDGFRAGVNHSARTGAGGFMGTVWPSASAPAGTPSSQINNNADEFKIWTSDALDNYLTTQANKGEDAYFELTNSGTSGYGYQFVATGDTNGDQFGAHFDAAHQPFLSFEQTALVPKWRTNDSGDWSVATNWFGQVVPDGIDKPAELGSWSDASHISYPNGTVAATLDTARTLGHLTFDSVETYNVTGSALTMNVSTGAATIDVLRGSQVISAPLHLATNTNIAVAGNAPSLQVSGDLTAGAGVTLTKTGEGILEVKNLRGMGLAANGGTVRITNNGTASGVSVLDNLTVLGAADNWAGQLDVTNNDVIIHSDNAGRIAKAADITNQLRQGANFAVSGQFWTGNGIISSLGGNGSTSYTAVGVAVNDFALLGGTQTGAIYSTFDGQPAGVNDVLMKYTYFGDADLDGAVTTNDYFQIDNGFLGSKTGWINGDFDYDGAVTTNDYFLIDNAFLGQGAAIVPASFGSASALSGVTAVPEPASLGAFALAAAGMFRRRRRTCRANL